MGVFLKFWETKEERKAKRMRKKKMERKAKTMKKTKTERKAKTMKKTKTERKLKTTRKKKMERRPSKMILVTIHMNSIRCLSIIKSQRFMVNSILGMAEVVQSSRLTTKTLKRIV